jgi:hypothetical protein
MKKLKAINRVVKQSFGWVPILSSTNSTKEHAGVLLFLLVGLAILSGSTFSTTSGGIIHSTTFPRNLTLGYFSLLYVLWEWVAPRNLKVLLGRKIKDLGKFLVTKLKSLLTKLKPKPKPLDQFRPKNIKDYYKDPTDQNIY